MNQTPGNTNPSMDNPNNTNPNLVPPPKESEDIVRQRKSSRSQNSALKNKNKQSKVGTKVVSFKNNGKKPSKKGSKSVEGMAGVEFDYGNSVREEEFDGYSIDSRSCGESVSERELQDVEGDDMVNGMPEVNVSKTNNDMNVSTNVGEIHVPVNENPVLNPSSSPVHSPRILKRGESLTKDNSKASAAFSFNNVEKWPSLGNGAKGDVQMGSNVKNVDVDEVRVMQDVNMKDTTTPTKTVSFAGALQGRKMCENAYGRASFARVLVEIEAASGLVDSVSVCYKSLGKSMELKVEYPWKPPICSHGKVFGHGYDKCNRRELTEAEKNVSVEINVQKMNNAMNVNNNGNDWQSASYKRNTRSEFVNNGYMGQRSYVGESSNSRGGYNGRGRGGMQGRGFNNQRFNRNQQAQYAPVNKANEVKKDSGKEAGLGDKDKGKGVVGNDGRSNGQNVSVGGINSSNKYSALADEEVMESNLEWEMMRNRIDDACEKGLFISVEEKNSWPKDLMEYYKKKMEKFVKKGSIDLLKSKIKNFEKSIQYSNESITMALKRKADSLDKSELMAQGLTENQAYAKVWSREGTGFRAVTSILVTIILTQACILYSEVIRSVISSCILPPTGMCLLCSSEYGDVSQ
ncbi:zinc knuckle CX2CX4HX4C [Artemisia annua]|uniref:Zinc knuckle CX2CX4HX4C n=1 Tax=Artemisia annua TaxID=35608 RepID=A0A2U1LKZ3_ARTAN|nr:zinc knuckle CX2CX4HX4C [Artemisia annua]